MTFLLPRTLQNSTHWLNMVTIFVIFCWNSKMYIQRKSVKVLMQMKIVKIIFFFLCEQLNCALKNTWFGSLNEGKNIRSFELQHLLFLIKIAFKTNEQIGEALYLGNCHYVWWWSIASTRMLYFSLMPMMDVVVFKNYKKKLRKNYDDGDGDGWYERRLHRYCYVCICHPKWWHLKHLHLLLLLFFCFHRHDGTFYFINECEPLF